MPIIQTASPRYEPGFRNFITIHMKEYPFIFSDEIKYRLRRHLALWASWWLFCAILYSYTSGISFFPNYKRLPVSMVDSFFFLGPHMFLSYSLMYLVIPQFIFRGRYILAVILVLILFFLTASFSALIGIYVLPEARLCIFGNTLDTRRYPSDFVFFLSLLAGLRGAITIGGLAAAIKLMKYWYMKEQRNLQLQKENIESQLQLLKAQVHPHFLFNTLNNIYSYTQNTSPVASRLVTGLSDMLRFILYECNQPLVPLAKELKMVQDYIALEQIRYGNKLDIHLNIPGKTNDLYIAPLLLLPLVENSFKHGASHMLEHPWVSLEITLNRNEMWLKLINGKPAEKNEGQKQPGIGIMNVEKRLSLLYPGRHQLTITSDADVYIVKLKIDLEQKKDFSLKLVDEHKPVYA
ncbi:MAG: histidine kinase [Bacteroidota bacterium]|nr:histidine kinase [Bacteroidota bacterium]